MKELLVLSGKGGTGKTSLIGSFAHLARSKVMLDCDVDASDLHLLLSPITVTEHEFRSGVKARVEADKCSSCGICAEICQFDSVQMAETAVVSRLSCEGCGVCAHFCPEDSIRLDENHCGTWYVSDTNFGPFVHSQLFAGEENSGKLVSRIKAEARKVAEENDIDLILIDGSPGVGCPVIASLSNTDMVLVVTEPSQSGKHDLERVLQLTEHFKIVTKVCINKWDLHPELAAEIESLAKKRNVEVLGKIPFDPQVVECQIQGIPVTASETSLAAYSIKDVWQKLEKDIDELPGQQEISLQ
ncbi:MAG: (4Fe-4S)-binding protein [Desulfocapsa sp.]|nr:MAG: (4Fe-4S)-binding protein [Desulfocapsa sp.]